MKFFKFLGKTALLFLGVMVLSQCAKKSEVETTENQALDTMAQTLDSETEKVANVTAFAQGIPSALHIADKFKLAGLTFTPGLTNKPENVSKYVTQYAKALNLGVYSSDLCYFIINNQNQETINSLTSAKKLASDLGVGVAYEESDILKRFEANLGVKDSLIEFLTDVAIESDMILKDEEKFDLVFVGFAGAWVESIYLATTMAVEKKNDELKRTVLMQQPALANLTNLLSEIGAKNEIATLLADLEAANKQMEEMAAPLLAADDPSKIAVDADKFLAYKENIAKIRNSVIQSN